MGAAGQRGGGRSSQLLFCFALDDLWSKKTCRPKMIVDHRCYIHLRQSCLYFPLKCFIYQTKILDNSGYFWPFLAISGYFWPFLAISGHFWLFPAIYGHLWPFLAFFWLFLALSGSFRLTYRPTDHQTNRPTDRPTYWFWLFLAILAWSIVLDDHWSKKIYRPKMIVWSGAIIHP